MKMYIAAAAIIVGGGAVDGRTLLPRRNMKIRSPFIKLPSTFIEFDAQRSSIPRGGDAGVDGSGVQDIAKFDETETKAPSYTENVANVDAVASGVENVEEEEGGMNHDSLSVSVDDDCMEAENDNVVLESSSPAMSESEIESTTDVSRDFPAKEKAWEEEIKRTQEFYKNQSSATMEGTAVKDTHTSRGVPGGRDAPSGSSVGVHGSESVMEGIIDVSEDEKVSPDDELLQSTEENADQDEVGVIPDFTDAVDDDEMKINESSVDLEESVASEGGQDEIPSAPTGVIEPEEVEGIATGTEITHVSDEIRLEKANEMLVVPSWQKAPSATASNKLVEEGLKHLARRDGDTPSIPYVITRAMRRVLIEELGYDSSEVAAMRPDVAVVIVAENLERPKLESLPSRFYSEEEEPPAAITVEADDISLKRGALSLFRRLRDKFSMSSAGRDPRSVMVMIASTLVALSFVLSPRRESASVDFPLPEISPKADEELSDNEEELYNESQILATTDIDVKVFPGDLDKTWLDKLISMMTKPFGT